MKLNLSENKEEIYIFPLDAIFNNFAPENIRAKVWKVEPNVARKICPKEFLG